MNSRTAWRATGRHALVMLLTLAAVAVVLGGLSVLTTALAPVPGWVFWPVAIALYLITFWGYAWALYRYVVAPINARPNDPANAPNDPTNAQPNDPPNDSPSTPNAPTNGQTGGGRR